MIVGALFGLFLAGYTGVLLSVSNQPDLERHVGARRPVPGLRAERRRRRARAAGAPVWRRAPSTEAKLSRADRYFILLELVLLVVFFLSLGAIGARFLEPRWLVCGRWCWSARWCPWRSARSATGAAAAGPRLVPGAGRRAGAPDRRDLRSADVGAPASALCRSHAQDRCAPSGRFDDAGDYLADARALDSAGVDSLWLDDGGYDPWLLLASVAAVTGRARLVAPLAAAGGPDGRRPRQPRDDPRRGSRTGAACSASTGAGADAIATPDRPGPEPRPARDRRGRRRTTRPGRRASGRRRASVSTIPARRSRRRSLPCCAPATRPSAPEPLEVWARVKMPPTASSGGRCSATARTPAPPASSCRTIHGCWISYVTATRTTTAPICSSPRADSPVATADAEQWPTGHALRKIRPTVHSTTPIPVRATS